MKGQLKFKTMEQCVATKRGATEGIISGDKLLPEVSSISRNVSQGTSPLRSRDLFFVLSLAEILS